MTWKEDHYYMGLALNEARKAFSEGEIPIGAVVVLNDKVIASAHNMIESLTDATAHAEMLALTAAQSVVGKYLDGATVYVTIEPCVMCAGAMAWTRPSRIVYGAHELRIGYSTVVAKNPFHPKTVVTSGVRAEEAIELMQSFFRTKRK